MLFRCTGKVQKKLTLTSAQLIEVASPASMTEWYCNLVTIERRQFYLFTHALSLFSCWVPVASIKSSGSFRRAFIEQLVFAMPPWGFKESDAEAITDDGQDVFAKAIDRRVLRSMVDYAAMCIHSAAYEEGLGNLGLEAMNRIANECPMSVINMGYPNEELAKLIHGRRGSRETRVG